MALRSLLTQIGKKGIASLRPKPKPKPKTTKPNRRLTPEEIAEKRLREAEADQAIRMRMAHKYGTPPPDEILGEYMRYKYASPVRSPGSTAMRAKKVGDETMEMIKDSVMKMDLPEAKKVEAIKSAATAIRNATPAELAKTDPSVLVKNFMSKYGPYIGIGVGYGVADNKEAIGDMLKATKTGFLDGAGSVASGFDTTKDVVGDMLKAVNLPTKFDVDLGMTPAGEIFGDPGVARGIAGQALFGLQPRPVPDIQEAVRFWKKEGLSDEEINLRLERLGYFNEPDPEPGLEEGMIPDLFINPMIDKLLGD